MFSFCKMLLIVIFSIKSKTYRVDILHIHKLFTKSAGNANNSIQEMQISAKESTSTVYILIYFKWIVCSVLNGSFVYEKKNKFDEKNSAFTIIKIEIQNKNELSFIWELWNIVMAVCNVEIYLCLCILFYFLFHHRKCFKIKYFFLSFLLIVCISLKTTTWGTFWCS